MSGSIAENLSNRKLCYILGCLLGAQIAFFMLGGIVAPQPSSSMTFLMSVCKDSSMGASGDWFYLFSTTSQTVRNGNCHLVRNFGQYEDGLGLGLDAKELVFVAQMPHIRDNGRLEYSKWFQTILALLSVDIQYHSKDKWDTSKEPVMNLEVRLGYKTKAEEKEWQELSSSSITRHLHCDISDEDKKDGYGYNCEPMELFELGSSDYPFYLLNIRIPSCNQSTGSLNCEIGRLTGLTVIEIHQNGGFTQVWLFMKTLVVVPVMAALYFYWSRIRLLPRNPYLVEKAIFGVGITMAFVDFPLEWLGFMIRMPFMLLLSDIRQGLFYTVLFSFWIIFLGEHLTGSPSKHSIKEYWRQLTTVSTASVCLFTFDMCERGVHLTNPFYSIWATKFGAKLAYGFLIVAAVAMCVYFVFIVGMMVRVWTSIKRKRADLYNAATSSRQIKFENVIYRFKFIMVMTGICVALTISSAIMSSIGEGQLRWGDHESSPLVHYTSAFMTGVFGNWNLYVILLLVLYAPSHKHINKSTPVDNEEEDAEEEDSLFGRENPLQSGLVTESSALTTFIKPSIN